MARVRCDLCWMVEKYMGEFNEMIQFHGQGELTLTYGGKHIGEFKDGERYGQGSWTNSEGKTSEGKFNEKKFNEETCIYLYFQIW